MHVLSITGLIWLLGYLNAFTYETVIELAPPPGLSSEEEHYFYCESRSPFFSDYHPTIKKAADDLIAMGVFTQGEFSGVRIDFCALYEQYGRYGTTNCSNDVVLLDEGYARKGRDLVLRATLAHEMKHVLQHRELRLAHGLDYCASNQYENDKPRLEAEADMFGDRVARLFFGGRAVEIRNQCSVPVSVYLEPNKPLVRSETLPEVATVPPGGVYETAERATSNEFRGFLEALEGAYMRVDWTNFGGGYSRIIGKEIRIVNDVVIGNPERVKGPFVLNVTCDPARND